MVITDELNWSQLHTTVYVHIALSRAASESVPLTTGGNVAVLEALLAGWGGGVGGSLQTSPFLSRKFL
jgi:hypothetical protein